MIQRLLVMAAALSLSACGDYGTAGLCEKSVKDELVNPETLQFRDFTAVSDEGATAVARNMLIEEVSDTENRDNTVAAIDMLASDKRMIDELKDKFSGIKFFHARIRAEGTIGNTVTKQALCGVYLSDTIKQCQCYF
jgi:hypothetical protein